MGIFVELTVDIIAGNQIVEISVYTYADKMSLLCIINGLARL